MGARSHALFGAKVGAAFLLLGTLLQAALGAGDGGYVYGLASTLAMPITWLVGIAPVVLGLLVGVREDRLRAREDEDREQRDRMNRATSAIRVDGAASAVHSGAQTLASSLTSFRGLTRPMADSIRESTMCMRQLTGNAARASQSAEKLLRLAETAKRCSQEGLLEITASVDELRKLTEETRGLAGDIEALDDRMRNIVGLASAMNHLGERFESLADSAAEEMAQAATEFPLSLHFTVSEMQRQGKDAKDGATLVQGIIAELQKAMATTVVAAQEGVSRAERGVQIANRVGNCIEQIGEALEASTGAVAEITSIASQQDEGMDVMAKAMNQAHRVTEEAAGAIERLAQEAVGLSRLASGLCFFGHAGRVGRQAEPPQEQAHFEARRHEDRTSSGAEGGPPVV
jgi:methyl-accepting chemotaxis protein